MRVRCRAVRYFDDPFPGVVEAYLTDCSGFDWQIVDKAPLFAEFAELDRNTAMPRDVTIDCRVVTDDGQPCVTVAIPHVSDRAYSVPRSALISD